MPTMNVHCWTEVLVYDTSDQPPILRSLHRCFNLHSYFASGTLNNSHNDGVGQSLAKVSPVAPVTGMIRGFFFFLAHLMTHMINSPQVHFKGDSPSRGLLPWTLHQLFYNSKSLLDEGQNEGLWIYKEKCHSQSLLSAFKNASLLYSRLQQIFTTQISTCMHFTTALMFCKTFAPIRLSSILSLS